MRLKAAVAAKPLEFSPLSRFEKRMNKIGLGQTIQILANIGVIAGIVFLAFELRQNNEALQTQALLERQDVRRVILARRQDNPAIVSATVKALREEPLSDEELFVLEEENLLRLVNWEITVMQVIDGLLSEDAIPAAGWRSEFNERLPGMRDTWESTKHMFPGEFVEYMDTNIANH